MCITIYHIHNGLQAYVTQNLVHVFPGQVQHMFIVMSVLGSLWLLLLAGISFLSTQLVSNLKLSIHGEQFFFVHQPV
jgi:hypothetical protein